MTFTPFASPTELQLQATTELPGFALQNATPTILSWTAPNDGQMHRILIYGALDVTLTLTGGQVNIAWTAPDGSIGHPNLFSANSAAGNHDNLVGLLIEPGATININQSSAVTAGAGVLWAEIWAS